MATDTPRSALLACAQRAHDKAQPCIAYHGTWASFESFRGSLHAVPRPGEQFTWTGEQAVIFFSSDCAVARTYGDRVIAAQLHLENPLVIDAEGKSWDEIIPLAYLPQAVLGGHDGIVVNNLIDVAHGPSRIATTYVAFSPDQVRIIPNHSNQPARKKHQPDEEAPSP